MKDRKEIQKLRNKADKLAAKYTKMRDKKCLMCGNPKSLDWAHGITRANKLLRHDPDNMFTLCHANSKHSNFGEGCHQLIDNYPKIKKEFMITQLGEDRYYELIERSHISIFKETEQYYLDVIERLKLLISQTEFGEL